MASLLDLAREAERKYVRSTCYRERQVLKERRGRGKLYVDRNLVSNSFETLASRRVVRQTKACDSRSLANGASFIWWGTTLFLFLCHLLVVVVREFPPASFGRDAKRHSNEGTAPRATEERRKPDPKKPSTPSSHSSPASRRRWML